MALDCRPTNACHRSLPHSALATPGSLYTIKLAESWLADGAAEGELAEPHAASIDLADGYYPFAVPEVSPWFGYGLQRSAAEVGLRQVFCEETLADVPVEGGELLWACFAVLPMGWLWGLYFCHDAGRSDQAELAGRQGPTTAAYGERWLLRALRGQRQCGRRLCQGRV